MKAIVFDVDDTLYDLSTPFKETCREVFPEDKDLDLEGAFLASRRYSDSVYARCLSGEMSMEEMYIYRFKNAFLDYGKKIDALKALEFQAIYEEKQHEIKMTDAMRQLMQNLKEKVTLGIVTNGPAQHQWDKSERTWCNGMDSSRSCIYIRSTRGSKTGQEDFQSCGGKNGDFAARDLLCRRFFRK